MKYLSILVLFCLVSVTPSAIFAQGFFSAQTLCSENDTRVLSYRSPIGRILSKRKKPMCTGSLVSRYCGVTAGHCASKMKWIEFNVPVSTEDGYVRSSRRDLYRISRKRRVKESSGVGRDYAVFQLKKNKRSKRHAGDIQGYLRLGVEEPLVGQELDVIGYGTASDPVLHLSQKSATGELIQAGNHVLKYRVDTTGGNSGSPILLSGTNKLVGIHAQGACHSQQESGNYGTSVLSPELYNAIITCILQSDTY